MKRYLHLLLTLLLLSVCTVGGAQTTVTYTISDKKAVTSNDAPSSTKASFATTYSGNKFQLPSGSSMTLTLEGYAGKKITGLKLSMKSNASAGAGYLDAKVGTKTLASLGSSTKGVNFNEWYDNKSYSTTYKDVNATVTATTVEDGEKIVITIGATENSLYVQSFTLTYGEASSKANAGLSFSSTTATATLGETFTAPTLNNPNNLTVSYSSSDESVATVDANGTVKLVAAGTTTIAAKSDETDTYAAGEASYTLTVSEKGTVSDNTETIDLTKGFSDKASVTTVNGTDVTATFAKGSNTTNAPKYYKNGTAVRLYSGNTLTISSTTKNITKIEITFSGDGYSNLSLTDGQTGTYKSGTWTGSSNSVAFTNGSSQSRIQSIKVTCLGEGEVAVPEISGEEEFYDKTTVTITAAEGCGITYSIDGTDPSSSKTAKSTDTNKVSFDVTSTTTVKAVAVDANLKKSSVAEKTFTKTEPITVAEALKTADRTEVIVKGIVASVSTWNSRYPNVNYWISDDGSTTSELEIYRGTGLNGADITSQNDITKGDIVILRGKLTTYNNTKELAEGSTLLSITKSDEKATVTAAGWATYVTNNAVSFPEGVTAYTVTYDATADKITLNPVTAVPAKTAVVLKAAAGTYTLTKVESADAPTSNNLTYSWSDKTIADGDNIYVLAQNNGVIGFWPTEVGSTLAAFKGYLDLGSNSSAKTFFALDGTATGINSINTDKANTRDVRYNLAGQRVGKNYKGVVVVNGKKMLVK